MQKRERLQNLNGVHCIDPRFSLANILFSMVGLISVGKPDHDAIEIFRSKPVFFHKSVWVGKTGVGIKGENYPFLSFLKLLFEVTECRTKKGQQLIFPEIEVDSYWCSVQQLTAHDLIELYH